MSPALVRKAARDLMRARRQFLALTAMVALGVASMTAIYGGYANIQDAIDDAYDRQEFHDGLVEFAARSPADLPDLSTVAGVRAWLARRVVDLPVTFADGGTPVLATFIAIPNGASPTIDRLEISAGGLPATDTPELVAEAGFAAHHGLEPGQAVSVRVADATHAFAVAGRATSPEYLWPAKTVQEHMPDVLRRWGAFWIASTELDRILGADQAGLVNQVVFTVDDSQDTDAVVAGVAQALGPGQVVRLETREGQASHVVLGLLVNGLNQIAFVLPLLFLTIVGLSTYVLLTRLVHEQRPAIGLLRALGYRPAAVLAHYLTYAPLIAGVGSLVGFGIGFALSFYVTDVFASFASLSGIRVRLRPDLFLLGLGMSLTFTTLASVLPARHAARLGPAEAMRAATPPRPPRLRTGHAQPFGGRVPFSLLLGLRSMGRHPRRAAFTALGLCLAVAVMIVPLGFLDSMDYTVERTVVDVQRADETLVFRQPVGTDVLAAAATLEGVAALEPLVQVQGGIFVGQRPVQVTLLGLAPGSDLLHLFDAEGDRMAVRDGTILLGRVLERDGVRVGDRLGLFGEEVEVAGFVQVTGTTGFVTLATAQRWAGLGDEANQALLLRAADASAADVHQTLEAALPLAATQDTAQALEDTRSMLRLYYGFIFLLLAFALAIAGAIVFNAVTINVLEQSRDFATLRTLGVSMRSLWAQTTIETMLLAIPGILVGLWLGRALTGYFVGVFSSDLFVLDLHVSLATFLIAGVAGVAVAFVSQVPSLRWIGRMDLAKSVRERAA